MVGRLVAHSLINESHHGFVAKRPCLNNLLELLLAVQCIVIGPVSVCVCCDVCVCLWVCYHDNSKLHASILTKLGL